jgi:hypothetical protein
MEQPATPRPSGFRFSLKTLLLAVVPVAIGAAALRNPGYKWTAVIVALTLFAFFAAIIAAVFDGGLRRARCFGFAVFSGGYLLVLLPATKELAPILPTEQVNRLLLKALHPGVEYPPEGVPIMLQNLEPKRSSLPSTNIVRRTAPSSVLPLATIFLRPLAAELLFAIDAADQSSEPQPAGNPNVSTEANATPAPLASPANAQGAAAGAKIADDGSYGPNFRVITQCIWAWFIGAAGAFWAGYLAARNCPLMTDDSFAAQSAAHPARARFRARSLYWAILPCWILFAGGYALCHASFGATLMASLGAVALIAAPLCATFGSRQRRPFHCGFAVCCGGWLVLYFLATSTIQADWFFETTLLSNSSLVYLANHLLPTQDIAPTPPGTFANQPESAKDQNSTILSGSPVEQSISIRSEAEPQINNSPLLNEPWDAPQFFVAGHYTAALFAGWLGGVFAQFLVWRRSLAGASRRRQAFGG